MIATLVGIFVGTLAALAADRYNERRRKRQRAGVILRSLVKELEENHATLKAVKPAYQRTAWGKSFYLSTIAWETALASGDLPAIIGDGLTDAFSSQYALLVRIRYHVGLLTQLWFAPAEIEGREDIRKGLTKSILDAMNQAINQHPEVLAEARRAGS
jgi:hypothetical protein